MLPVTKILYSVKELLAEIETIDIQAILNKGLKNKIDFVDLDGGNTTMSHITSDGQVVLSVGFCQLLWNICYVALRNSECKRFADSCEELKAPSELLKQIIIDVNLSEFAYLTEAFKAESDKEMLSVGYNCINHELSSKEHDFFKGIDMNNSFCQTVNGLCGAAVTFVLLHELFHWERDHFYRSIRRIEKEREADKYAFETMLNNYTGKKKNTAIIGAICCLCANLFINPRFSNDGNYPYEDERLFTQYNKVSSYKNLSLIVDQIITIWAGFFHNELTAKLKGLSDTQARINLIQKELAVYGR